MAENITPSYLPAPDAVHARKPTPVPEEKWVGTVKSFTKKLGDPELLKSGAPVQTVKEADEAKWGDDESGVDLVRSQGQQFVSAGNSIFLQTNSMREFHKLISDFEHLELKVKDPVTKLIVYRDAHFGLIKKEVLTYGSFYLNENKENLAKSDVVGVVDVGHNPPPRSVQHEE